MRLSRPQLRVSQAQSAFAAGNARWTNRDLDPIPLMARKWGVISLIGEYPDENKTAKRGMSLH